MVAGGYGRLSLWKWVMVKEAVVNAFIVERRGFGIIKIE